MVAYDRLAPRRPEEPSPWSGDQNTGLAPEHWQAHSRCRVDNREVGHIATRERPIAWRFPKFDIWNEADRPRMLPYVNELIRARDSKTIDLEDMNRALIKKAQLIKQYIEKRRETDVEKTDIEMLVDFLVGGC